MHGLKTPLHSLRWHYPEQSSHVAGQDALPYLVAEASCLGLLRDQVQTVGT
ncbi:MAG: hypothetical protein WA148_02135 [Actinomycetota bacterium]